MIVVCGLPGSGKTTLARGLARELGLPLLYKDGFKEALFDTLGTGDLAWSRRLGVATYSLLYYATRATLQGGASLIVESNFDQQLGSAELSAIAAATGARLAQVLCQTDGPTLVERFTARAMTPERHPGHLDHEVLQEQLDRFRTADYAPLALDGPLLIVDTTNFANADPAIIAAQLRPLLQNTIE